jgi:hypothetical protein
MWTGRRSVPASKHRPDPVPRHLLRCLLPLFLWAMLAVVHTASTDGVRRVQAYPHGKIHHAHPVAKGLTAHASRKTKQPPILPVAVPQLQLQPPILPVAGPQLDLLPHLPFQQLRDFNGSRVATNRGGQREFPRGAPPDGCAPVPAEDELPRDGGPELCAYVPYTYHQRSPRSAGAPAVSPTISPLYM